MLVWALVGFRLLGDVRGVLLCSFVFEALLDEIWFRELWVEGVVVNDRQGVGWVLFRGRLTVRLGKERPVGLDMFCAERVGEVHVEPVDAGEMSGRHGGHRLVD